MNSHSHSITGRFLIAPLVNSELFLLKRFQQFNCNFFDALDINALKIWLFQQVEDGQRFFIEPLSYCSAFFFVESLDES